MVGKVHRGTGLLVLLILVFAITGSFLGELLQPYIPLFLTKSFILGIGPLPINLRVINATFGLTVKMNVMSIIGIIVGLVVYKKAF